MAFKDGNSFLLLELLYLLKIKIIYFCFIFEDTLIFMLASLYIIVVLGQKTRILMVLALKEVENSEFELL